MTNAPQVLECSGQAGEEIPALLEGAGLSGVQNCRDLHHEDYGVVLQFGDLGSEENRICLIKSLVLGVEVAGFDADTEGLETAFMMLPSSAVNELVSTFGKCAKSFSKRAPLLLEGMKNGDVSERDAEASHPSL